MCIREGFKPRLSSGLIDSTSLTNSWVWTVWSYPGRALARARPELGLARPGRSWLASPG